MKKDGTRSPPNSSEGLNRMFFFWLSQSARAPWKSRTEDTCFCVLCTLFPPCNWPQRKTRVTLSPKKLQWIVCQSGKSKHSAIVLLGALYRYRSFWLWPVPQCWGIKGWQHPDAHICSPRPRHWHFMESRSRCCELGQSGCEQGFAAGKSPLSLPTTPFS